MDFQLESRDGRLRASGDMNIYSAGAMKQQLLVCMATIDGDVLFDLSEVAEIDTCGLQILLIAERIATSEGRSFKVVDPSAAASEVLALCGLDRMRSDASRRAA
jgi:anti-anti-sigma factor